MVGADKRRSLILSTAGYFFFGAPVLESDVGQDAAVLENFLEQATCRTLYAQPSHADDGARLKLSKDMPHGRNTLVFFKLRASSVTEANFYDVVQVSSTGDGKGSILIEALRQVWAPAFQSSYLSASYIKKLEENLLGPPPPTSILEEENYWLKKRDTAKRPHDRTIYEDVVKILKNIRAELESATVSRDGLIGVDEALEIVSGFVDDLWKLGDEAYSEERIKSLIDIIGNEVVSIVQCIISEVPASDDRAKDETITLAANICEKWTTMTEKFTILFWPHHSLHPWKGPKFSPQRSTRIGRRLRQIAELRAQYRQLTRLLTSSERTGLATDSLIQCFDDVRAVFNEDENTTDWDRLRKKVEEGLFPAEEKVSQKLKAQIAEARTPSALLAEFRRYFDLMKREGLQRNLRGERENLLAAYNELIESCLAGPDTGDLFDSPKILQEIQAARSAETRLESLKEMGKDLFTDLSGYKEVSAKVSAALKDVERRKQSLIDSWVEETRAAIVKKELTLGTDTAVVELTGTSMMKVTYDPRLVTLIREARALSGQGIELPREVRDLVERAGLLAGRARALQQVATFHNTIGDRMVPSQRPLMLTTALELARAVREQSGVVWSDPQAVDAYTARLKELVRKFARQNSELAAKHCLLRDLLSKLFKGEAINLIGNQSIWKDTLSTMRQIVDTVEAEYGNTKAWKLHWDRQLLKALSMGYRGALPLLLRKLPEIRVELTFRDDALQWRPSLEEIRAKLYSSVRRSLSIPMNFRGVGDPADAQFGELVQKTAYLFGGVYKQAETVLSTMEAVRKKWLPLAALAKVDVTERLKGKSPREWTNAFKDAKQWAQEVGKLRRREVKIWCITIDTATTRNDLESASRRYWERLSSDLRVAASSRLVGIVDFLSSTSKELDRRPRNVEEVGLAYEGHARIQQQLTSIADEMEAVVGLAKVLSAWTSEKLDGVTAANTAWENLADRLERHKAMVDREFEDAKVNLQHKGLALRDERERWEAKWSAKPEVLTFEWITSIREKWDNLAEQRNALKIDCQRVGLDVNEILDDDEEILRKFRVQLEAEESNCRFQAEFLQELRNQEEEEWSVARRRLPRLQDWLLSWESRVQIQSKERQDQQSLGQKDSLEIDTFIGRKVQEVRTAIEWIQILRGDELADEHWVELKSLLQMNDVKHTRDITLGHLLSSTDKIQENIEKVKDITKKAAAESGIRQALVELESWEASASLQLQEVKDSKNVSIALAAEYGSLLARAGELRLLLEGARGASGYERFAARAARCEAGLSELEERIKILSTVQRKWIYLEPVYLGGAAPNDSGRWSRVDKEFRYLMGEVSRDPRVPSLRRLPLPALINLKDLLEKCQKSLDEYLEEKRSSYPRLYFLSDEDLLELVSSSGRGLEAHLPKLYQGVGSVLRDESGLTAVVSSEGEVLRLPDPIDLKDPLAQWLRKLEEGMKNALQRSLEKCLVNTTPDPSIYPTQVLLLAERIRFTERCEAALKQGRSSMRNLVEFLETQRARYRGLEDAGDRLTASKARGLLLDTVHHLEVARSLFDAVQKGDDPSWLWHRQLRTLRTSKGPIVRCAEAEFPYRFEYQGAAVGLVRTPLTERCFLALTQAMKLGLGGSPTGPAGTGKTESVKALAAMLGRFVVVFNCDEGMDAGSMSRILGGLAQAGAWGCFDEFNRLEEETLSAVAMLIRPLQEAVRDGASQVLLGDQRIKLDPDCCVFITMNPAGTQYGGRHKLPDSLARLFRPIGMAQPDRSDIVRTLLECAGFLDAPTLASQLVETLDMAEIVLSKQPHYDWGLRALRSVLDAVRPEDEAKTNETARLLIAIRTSTLPKLTEEDAPKFNALLDDVFQKANTTSTSDSDELVEILNKLCDERGLNKDKASRCIQLKDQLRSRTGVAIVGPPGSGKTTIWRLLRDALIKKGETVNEFLIYPGAIPKSRLLGRVNPITREWQEGLLSTAVISSDKSATWIIFDGDVEPDWAEALNSALDDNRQLTLSNGVCLRLPPGIRFIFETHKLAGASPATVSRLGVVHLGSVGPATLLSASQLSSLPESVRELTASHLPTCIDETLKVNEEFSSASSLVEFSLRHLSNARTHTFASYGILVALCGQIADENPRDRLAHLIYQLTDTWCPNPQKPYDVLYNEDIDRFEPNENATETITTEDGVVSLSGTLKRAIAAVLPWVSSNQPIMIRGPEGCGKTTLISILLSRIRNHENATLIKGSSLYGPQDLITRLKRVCVQFDSSSHGRTYKPRNGSRVVLVLDDLHLARKDLQELVRQLLQEGGFYDEDLQFARVALATVCTADATTRLQPRLEVLLPAHHLPQPNSKDTAAVLELHLRDSLKGEKVLVESWITRMSPVILEAFRSMIPSESSSFACSQKDLILWADSLRYYPSPEDEVEITHHLLDAGRRLFHPRLTAAEQSQFEAIIRSTVPNGGHLGNDVYIWRSGDVGLQALTEDSWRDEIIKVAARCAREGEPVHASISLHLLQTVAGITWALGVNLRGILLIGRPGAGRRTAVRLAATFASMRLVDSAPGRGKAAVKIAVQSAGIDGEPTVLLLEEHHAREEYLAVLAGAIVSRGELPGLFSGEELDGLIAPLSDLARREDFTDTLEQYLYYRLRRHLRVVVILDSGEARSVWLSKAGLLKQSALIGPGLGNEWWCNGAPLIEEANQQINPEKPKLNEPSDAVKVMVNAQLRAPRPQQAPARFSAMLHAWRCLHERWSDELQKKLARLEAGISKLREAGEQVAKLEDQVSGQRQELEAEKGRANAALEQITATMRGATGQRGEITNLKAETERESAELARRKADIEGELGKVEPLVEQAAQAVAGISADALAEVRSLRAPPAPVRDVLEGVLRLMGIKDTSWNSMKTFLAKRGIKDEIRQAKKGHPTALLCLQRKIEEAQETPLKPAFTVESILAVGEAIMLDFVCLTASRTWDARRSTSSSLDAVAKLVKERPESFQEKTAKRASVAAAPLAAWVLANLQYGQIVQQVAPLEREQRVLAERLSAAEAQIGRLAAGLTSVESRVAQLQEELAEHSRGAAALQLRAETTEAKLTIARSLLQKLDTEHRDWQAQLEELTSRKERLALEAANVASLLVYQDLGKDDKWRKSAIELLISEREKLLWRAQGLPADTGSLVGAACALRGHLVPIFLDPTGIAVSWLKATIGTSLETTKPEEVKFLVSLELAVRFGKPLLVEEIVQFPPILLPLLRRRPLKIGERTLPAQQGFKLFLATRRERLDNVPKEAEAVLFKVALGAGGRSLAERFVQKILLKETPELVAQRREALEREEKLAGERDAARLELLAQLGTARGHELLQESEGSQGGVLASLEATQTKAREIALAIDEGHRRLEEVSRRAIDHEQLAKFAANLYKSVKALTALSPLYLFSVEAFTDIYLEAESYRSSVSSEEKREQDKQVEKRLITLVLYHCTKAAYRKHRLPLALHLALSLNPVPDVERNLLLDESSSDGDPDYNAPQWIPDERTPAVRALAASIPQVAGKMKPVYLDDISSIYVERSLTSFQKVLLIKTLRPDYLHTALSKLAAEQLGVKDLAPPAWSLKQVAEEGCVYPVLLLLSPGADPGTELRSLAANHQVASALGFREVSLGQGQVAQAEAALETACREGSWILLSNLQLALNWLPRLESLLRSAMCTANKNPSTRIWLTTEECSGFYPSLAGLCLKLAYEPPEGIKRNVKRSLQQLQQQQKATDGHSGLFLLSWLHATLQERRNFVPHGWARAYDWNESDLEAACELVLKNMKIKKGLEVNGNWESGRGLLDAAVYGGRLQDPYDVRALTSIIREIWCPEVLEGRRKLAGVLRVSEGSLDDVIRSLDRLGDSDSPKECFGLPANAHRAWERSAAEIALFHLKGMSGNALRTASKHGKETATKVQRDVRQLLEKYSSISASASGADVRVTTNPLESFFSSELHFVRILLGLMHSDVETLKFEDSKTPKNWLSEWKFGPKDVLPFVKGLITIFRALESLSSVLQWKLDLSRLIRPRVFLAALKQHTARETGRPLDTLQLCVNWSEDRKQDWKVSLTLEGLLISGASIRNGVLSDVDAEAAPVAAVPACQVAFVSKEYNEASSDDKSSIDRLKDRDAVGSGVVDIINIPLYENSQREMLICSLPVGCPWEERDAWLRRGVAFHLRSI